MRETFESYLIGYILSCQSIGHAIKATPLLTRGTRCHGRIMVVEIINSIIYLEMQVRHVQNPGSLFDADDL